MRPMQFLMDVWFLLASIVFLCSPPAHAQSPPTTASRGALRGTVFGGGLSTGSEVLPDFGGAIEFGIHPRVSLGGEASIVVDAEDKTSSLLLSARARYAFANPSTAESAWVPFVAAGLGRAVSFTNGFDVGGGVEYWGRDQFAVRLESLTHLFFDSEKYVEFRVGVVFRRSVTPRP